MDPTQQFGKSAVSIASSPAASGALDQSYLSRGRPLGEVRLIFEIGLAGADARSCAPRSTSIPAI